MDTCFKDLGISPSILKALEEIGFEQPTEVQSRAIPHILNNEDLIVMSKTGSGKTAVFGVPMAQLIDCKASEPQGLILTPTRELAVQIDNDIKKYSKYLKHRTTAVYGQHNINIEVQNLSKGTSIVTGTPGRVFDHISQGTLKTNQIRFLVLDEADRMLDMGFLDQVVKIIKTIPKDRVTLLFSATMPAEMHRICRNYMRNPLTIEIESDTMTVDTIHQVYYRVNYNEKNTQLNRLLLIERPSSCIIFCNTRSTVDRVQNFLFRKGYSCQALHGDIPQSKRLKTIQQFKQCKFPLLVATDVAARGIHVENLSLVVNYDVPLDKDNYVHRIGRTGRAGNDGRALSLVTSDEIMTLYEIEEHIGTMIAEEQLPTDDTLNEQKAQSDEWVKLVSHNIKIPPRSSNYSSINENRNKQTRSASSPKIKGVPNNRSYEKHTKLYDKNNTVNPRKAFAKNHPDLTSSVYSTDNKVASGKVIHRKVVSTKGCKNAMDTKMSAAGNVQSMQNHAYNGNNTKFAQGHSTASINSGVADIKASQSAKKPLLKRIVQRLFGK